MRFLLPTTEQLLIWLSFRVLFRQNDAQQWLKKTFSQQPKNVLSTTPWKGTDFCVVQSLTKSSTQLLNHFSKESPWTYEIKSSNLPSLTEESTESLQQFDGVLRRKESLQIRRRELNTNGKVNPANFNWLVLLVPTVPSISIYQCTTSAVDATIHKVGWLAKSYLAEFVIMTLLRGHAKVYPFTTQVYVIDKDSKYHRDKPAFYTNLYRPSRISTYPLDPKRVNFEALHHLNGHFAHPKRRRRHKRQLSLPASLSTFIEHRDNHFAKNFQECPSSRDKVLNMRRSVKFVKALCEASATEWLNDLMTSPDILSQNVYVTPWRTRDRVLLKALTHTITNVLNHLCDKNVFECEVTKLPPHSERIYKGIIKRSKRSQLRRDAKVGSSFWLNLLMPLKPRISVRSRDIKSMLYDVGWAKKQITAEVVVMNHVHGVAKAFPLDTFVYVIDKGAKYHHNRFAFMRDLFAVRHRRRSLPRIIPPIKQRLLDATNSAKVHHTHSASYSGRRIRSLPSSPGQYAFIQTTTNGSPPFTEFKQLQRRNSTSIVQQHTHSPLQRSHSFVQHHISNEEIKSLPPKHRTLSSSNQSDTNSSRPSTAPKQLQGRNASFISEVRKLCSRLMRRNGSSTQHHSPPLVQPAHLQRNKTGIECSLPSVSVSVSKWDKWDMW